MASFENLSDNAMDRMCAYVLRRKRGLLLRELSDVKPLVGNSKLSPLFTHYEREEVCGSGAPRDRAEKFITAIENRGGSAYKRFISVLKDFKPSLAHKLSECEKEWSRRASEKFVNRAQAERWIT